MKSALLNAVLAVYLMALLLLLLAPISTGAIQPILAIDVDKWVHLVLFAGLGALLRWKLGTRNNASFIAVAGFGTVAVATEIAQHYTGYRHADFGDLTADIIGGILGVLVANRVMGRSMPERLIGAVVSVIGLGIGLLFALADVIGLGANEVFGTVQITGAAMGLLVALGGVAICWKG